MTIQELADRFAAQRGEMDEFERAAFQDLVERAKELEIISSQTLKNLGDDEYNFEYLITYAHKGGFGNATIEITEEITSTAQIRDIEISAQKDYNLTDVVILNVILLKRK